MGRGTGFFMPRTAEDAAALRSKDRSTETTKPTSRDAGDEAKRGERASRCRQTSMGGLKTASNTPSTWSTPAAQVVSRDAALSTSQPSVHQLAVSCGNRLIRNRSFSHARSMYGTKPLVRSVQSATAPISTTSNADLNNSNSWLPGGQSSAGGSYPNSEELFSIDDAACCYSASAAGLHLSALPELLPPEASVSSWDELDVLPQHSTTTASSSSGSSSATSLTPCVSPATLGVSTPAAAPGPYAAYNSSSICGPDLLISYQGGPAAGDGPASDDMIIPHYSGSLLQSGALLSSSNTLQQQQQQASAPAAAGSPPALNTLLQLRSKLAAARVAAEATGEACIVSDCNFSSSLLSTELPAGPCFSAPVNAGGLLGSSAPAHGPLLHGGLDCEQGTSAPLFQCGFTADLQPSLYNPTQVPSVQLSNDPGACFSGSFAQFDACQPSASIIGSFSPAGDMASQQLLGNDMGAMAAAIAQEKLQQLQQLEVLQQQLRQEVVGLLPLI